jgi:molecular chaperone Hsp33
MTEQIATGADAVLPFQVDDLGVRGRLVRINETANPLLIAERYPAAVAALLLDTLVLTALLASTLKYDGVFSLQIQGDGPVSLLVADARTNGDLRAYGKYDETALDETLSKTEGLLPHLVGAGHMAFTVDQGPDTERYQGITELTGETLAESAANYFRLSEQLDTVIISAQNKTSNSQSGITAAALMVQRLPNADPQDDDAADAWREAAVLAGSVKPNELLDPHLSAEELLFRLYHQNGVRVFSPQPVRYACRCSRERVSQTLASFPREEVENMRVDENIAVTCEYCGTAYAFGESDLDALFSMAQT